MEEENKTIFERLEKIEGSINELKERLAVLEKKTFQLAPKIPVTPERPEKIEVLEERPPLPPGLAPSPPDIKREDSFEAILAGNWLVWVGAVALFAGVGFFLKYAFDHWIGPTTQVVMGLLAGLLLIGLQEYWRSRYEKYSQALGGAGIAIWYVSVFAAFGLYHLVPLYPAFLLMAVITAIGGLLAVRYNADIIAFLAILGGFLTPFILGIRAGQENRIVMLAYLVLLNLGILAISLWRNWRPFSLTGLLFTYFSFWFWLGEPFRLTNLAFVELSLTIFFLLFAFITIVYHLINQKAADWPDLALMTMNAAIYFGWSYGILYKEYRAWMGLFSLGLALFYLILASLAYLRNRQDPYLTSFLSGISVVFITIAIPLQLTSHWITIGWLVEAMVLSGLGFYLKSHHLRAFSLGAFLLVGSRLFLLDAGGIESRGDFVPFFNERFFVFLASIVGLYLTSYLWWLSQSEIKEEEKNVLPALLISANLLTIWIVSHETIRYFNEKIVEIQRIYGGRDAIFRTKMTLAAEKIRNLAFLRNLLISMFWTVYAFLALIVSCLKKYKPLKETALAFLWLTIAKVLLFDILGMGQLSLGQNLLLSFIWTIAAIATVVLGIVFKYPKLRVAGLSLLWAMVFKVFLFDTWKLVELYRVAAYISLGLILLITGYLYLRFQERIKKFLAE